jgi:hypothetical protein
MENSPGAEQVVISKQRREKRSLPARRRMLFHHNLESEKGVSDEKNT